MDQIVRAALPTISRPLTDVIDDFVLLKRSIHTQIAYRNDIEQFFNKLGWVMLEDLAAIQFSELVSHLQKYINELKKVESKENRQRVINGKTVNRKVNALRAFFKYLVSVYGYPKNPLDQFTNLKTDNFSNTESLSRSEVIDLLEYAKANHRKNQTGFRNYLMVIFLFNLALRVEECSTLQWNDLDLAMQKVNIYQKGGSYKLLPLPHSLCLLIQEFKALYGDTCPYIFHPLRNNSHNTINKPISTRNVFNIIKAMSLKVVPAKKITPHSLRKTFIELALDNGDDLIAICNATGHNSVEMVKYYDTRDSLKNNAVNSLAGLI